MSSKWVEIRDSIEDALGIEEVGQKMKGDFITWLSAEGIEFAQKFVDSIIAECKADAPNESGWCKIRDAFVVPTALSIAMYVLKVVLEKSAKEK